MKTESEIEKEINVLKEQLSKNQISKKVFLEKNIELMEYSLKNLNLTLTKRRYIRNALRICNMTRRFL